jgi:hypothetical protein
MKIDCVLQKKKKKRINKLSKKIQYEMDSYMKQPISIFLNENIIQIRIN